MSRFLVLLLVLVLLWKLREKGSCWRTTNLLYDWSVERFLTILVNMLTTLWSFSFPGAI